MKSITSKVAYVVAVIAAAAVFACHSPDAPMSDRVTAGTSIELSLSTHTLEPGQATTGIVSVRGVTGVPVPPGGPVEWLSSDSAIASVANGVISARQPGEVTITATVAGRSAAQPLSVAWGADASLAITGPLVVRVGVRFKAQAFVRNLRPVPGSGWTSSDAAIATVDTLGIVTALSVGQVTLSAQFAGLVGSGTITIIPLLEERQFGYFYSNDIPQFEEYGDLHQWTPSLDRSYSTSGAVTLLVAPPYALGMDFGWTGPASPLPGIMLQAVALDMVSCAADLNARTDLTWIGLGVPEADCWDGARDLQSDRMELIAASPGAFSGTVALVRPGMPAIMSSGIPIHEVSSGAGMRDYEVPTLDRDSLYWFLTPALPVMGSCSVAPAVATPASATARIACRIDVGLGATPDVYGIGFGTNAARGDAPRGFAELDNVGRVVRAAGGDLTITTTSQSAVAFDVRITGARMAEFTRLPAVFMTPVSLNAPFCRISDLSRAGSTLVTLRVLCDTPADGLLIGVVY